MSLLLYGDILKRDCFTLSISLHRAFTKKDVKLEYEAFSQVSAGNSAAPHEPRMC